MGWTKEITKQPDTPPWNNLCAPQNNSGTPPNSLCDPQNSPHDPRSKWLTRHLERRRINMTTARRRGREQLSPLPSSTSTRASPPLFWVMTKKCQRRADAWRQYVKSRCEKQWAQLPEGERRKPLSLPSSMLTRALPPLLLVTTKKGQRRANAWRQCMKRSEPTSYRPQSMWTTAGPTKWAMLKVWSKTSWCSKTNQGE